MKRQFFLVSGVGSLALARLAAAPGLAAILTDKPRVASVSIRRHIADTGVPGGCSNHRKRSAANGYTLAYALSGGRFS
jgi:hypothetical protein